MSWGAGGVWGCPPTALALGGIVILFLVILLVSRTITRPLRVLAEKARSLGAGDLDSELPDVRSRDEVGRLTHAFSRMRKELKNYIAELTATTAEKERIEADLRIAHDIQQSMVPSSLPDAPCVEMSALLRPARAVGGDLYDVFRMGTEEIAFLIGDVSGKGVPAALMMAVASTLLRTLGANKRDPGLILSKANAELAADNDACLFVTAFLGILNPKTGEIRYANAGHTEPMLLRRGAKAEYLAVTPSLPLGIEEEVEFANESLTLEPGEAILLYTDGITEAFNPDHVAFGEERFLDGLSGKDWPTVGEVVAGTVGLVDEFTAGAPQSDDLTMLVVRYGGAKSTERAEDAGIEVILGSDLEEMPGLMEAMTAFGESHGLTSDVIMEAQLVLEEAVANSMNHGFTDDADHRVEVRIAIEGQNLILEVTDDGIAYDPLARPPVDVDAPLEERPVGGLGVHLIRSLMDDVTYERIDDRNCLRMRKSLG